MSTTKLPPNSENMASDNPTPTVAVKPPVTSRAPRTVKPAAVPKTAAKLVTNNAKTAHSAIHLTKSDTPPIPEKSASPVISLTPEKTTKSIAIAMETPKQPGKKNKRVRDSFSLFETEYTQLKEIKKNCLKAGLKVKKSDLLRLGIALVGKMDVQHLQQATDKLSPLKSASSKSESSKKRERAK